VTIEKDKSVLVSANTPVEIKLDPKAREREVTSLSPEARKRARAFTNEKVACLTKGIFDGLKQILGEPSSIESKLLKWEGSEGR
jgi:hypothetical protein